MDDKVFQMWMMELRHLIDTKYQMYRGSDDEGTWRHSFDDDMTPLEAILEDMSYAT